MIGAISYQLNHDCEVQIYLDGSFKEINWKIKHPSELGGQYATYEIEEAGNLSDGIIVTQGLDGQFVLRFVETKRYKLKVINKGESKVGLPKLQNEGNKYLKCVRDEDSLTFQYINYLGKSKMIFLQGDKECVLRFEVVPDKIDYDKDYIQLTKAIAEIFTGLLLEYSGSTSNTFEQSGDNPRTPMEQFIFLRQFCYEDDLRGLMESIKRNPDRILEQEEEFKPIGTGKPSKKFYSNPFSYGRNWAEITVGGRTAFLPQSIAVTRKYDSLNTPANRFVKFALQEFDSVCTGLIGLLTTKSNLKAGSAKTECYEQAVFIHETINDILRDKFFDDIGPLDIMPQNNQVLQKREGYSQIFRAYGMIDLALQLQWEGEDSIYEGESKNTALLYEYWLFFELVNILKSIPGCEMVKTDGMALSSNKDGLTISLKEGITSRQAFELKDHGLKVNLYYNRKFIPKPFDTGRYEGSYSRIFRPDYTLAIYPLSYSSGKNNGEREALRNGAVSYVHFDAKYKIADILSIIGKDTDEDDKTDSVVNNYKREDLLKMHTYNDAIRWTIGSYVLYPGTNDNNQSGNKVFSLYDETFPGVGAFAIKPSNSSLGESNLKEFIKSLIIEKSSRTARFQRMKCYAEMILREPTIGKTYTPVIKPQQKNRICIIGYIRDDYYEFLEKNALLKYDAEFLFYCYAIKGDYVYTHHKDVFMATDFRFYINRVYDSGEYKVEPVLSAVLFNELVSKTELVKRLRIVGYSTNEQDHPADFYYVFRVKVKNDNVPQMSYAMSDLNSMNGNDTVSPLSPKVIYVE